jgi:acetyltransferase-like isoleucine patch superfamily enzyme
MDKIVNLITKLLTCVIINRKLRKNLRLKLVSRWYGRQVFKTAKSIGKNLHIRGYSKVNKETVIGDFVNFNGLQVHGSGCVMFGNHFYSGIECLIITSNHNYEGEKIPYDETNISKTVTIDNFVWLGSRVMILPGTHIGEGAIIQGGSVVHGEIPPYAIAGGNPAKVFKYRDIEHFKKLKAEGKFL